MVLGHNGHAISADQLARGRFVGSGQVEQVVRSAAGLTLAHQVVVLGPADHLAAMGDGLHVILILVARLIQGILAKRQEEWLINQQDSRFQLKNVVRLFDFFCLSLCTSHTCRICHVFKRGFFS